MSEYSGPTCGYCRDCKHFAVGAIMGTVTPDYKLQPSACALTEVQFGRITHEQTLAFGHWDGWNMLSVKPDFGCVQWEPKP